MAKKSYDKLYNEWKLQSKTLFEFSQLASSNSYIKIAVFNKYNESNDVKVENYSRSSIVALNTAASYVWRQGYVDDILKTAASQQTARDNQNKNPDPPESNFTQIESESFISSSPFDRRLDRIEEFVKVYTPYSTAYKDVTSSGYLMPESTISKLPDSVDKYKLLENRKREYERMKNDGFYTGVPALQNTYALVRLYGSKGGSLLVNHKNQRRWYEVDVTSDQAFNYASTPTTSALIDWGNADPYGRTPYHFTDFVFSKYWKKIENNRLITLRRYAAPILDNLKFPGMSGETGYGSGETGSSDDKGNSKNGGIPFPPMASAITYLGGETGNSLNNILKFTTGVLWEDLQAEIWNVTADSVPDNTSGISKIFKGIGSLSEILGVAADKNFNSQYIMNEGQLPPDPYDNGPYENRIKGPINRIDTVKKRKPGLDFKMDGLSLVFEYVARPVGGINTKAVLLDILSNFLVIGSASAVFFGGAHRFMANPAKYPFVGNIKSWYEGRPIEWSKSAIQQFAGEGGMGRTGVSAIWESAKNFISSLLGGDIKDAFSNIFTQGNAIGNLIKNDIAKKTAGQVPYLQGMRAILTGEPVGEWHITVGNPLNPIAMIGNLICDGITVEFNEELGPDDFPTEMKITVSLKHGMARDRDAIESIFNRGMGRIYNLPDSFLGSADFQTTVDQPTQDKVQTGLYQNAGKGSGILYKQGLDSRYVPTNELNGTQNQMSGSVSIWNRNSFKIGVSENSDIQASTNDIFKSAHRAARWIAERAQT